MNRKARRLGRVLGPLRATALGRAMSVAVEQRRAARSWRRGIAEIASYHEARRGREPGEALSDRVWSDLELQSVYERIDRCGSPVGQQVLYDMLRRPLYDASAILRRGAAISALRARPELRDRIRAALHPLAHPVSYDLHHLTASELPGRPRWYFLLPLLGLAAPGALLAMSFAPLAGLLMLIGVAGINIGIQIYYRPRVQHLIRAIAALPGLVRAARTLGTVQAPELDETLGRLRGRVDALRWARWFFVYIRLEFEDDPLVGSIIGYLNLLLLADVNAFVFSVDAIARRRRELDEIVRAVGLLDALCAVAEFRDSLPHCCAPEFDGPAKTLLGEAIYHPSLDDPVPNDLRMEGASWLITGSNMAGKTTFLRAAGACAVLAQTIATCPARRWRAPILRVHTFIGRRDDLLRGKSYFYVEAEQLREMLIRSAEAAASLFVIDELYRGTNTGERVAASRAVLEALNAGDHLCLVATHDLELVDLLRGPWAFRHFQETIADGEIHFDYRLRPGAATAGNALKLLEAFGYPAEVLSNARSTFDELLRRSGAVVDAGAEQRTEKSPAS
ncbi:MAG: hypothetical protein FWJ74_06230 [Gemmatimonadota bacterium]